MSKTNSELLKNVLAGVMVLLTISIGTFLVMGFWH